LQTRNYISLKAKYIQLYTQLMQVRQDEVNKDSVYILLNDKTLVAADEEAIFHFFRHKKYKEDALIRFWYRKDLTIRRSPLTQFIETPFNKLKDLELFERIILSMEATLLDWDNILVEALEETTTMEDPAIYIQSNSFLQRIKNRIISFFRTNEKRAIPI